MKNYISSSLAFYDTKIVVEDNGSNYNNAEVMMDWEAPIMSASAAYITQGGGDILEIGFGMGIASGYIQSHSISSHTIIENHPQMITKAVEWKSGKSNVTIVSQSWYDVKDSIGKFDGIFMDTFGDRDYPYFSSSLSLLTKSGTKVTFWNNSRTSSNAITEDVTYQEVSVTSTANSYWSGSIYYIPKLEF